MPFTPSHVAAALPFTRTALVPAALVIGTMGPDLVYFVPLPIHRTFTHSLPGVFTVDVVLGVLVYLFWRLIFRRPVTDFAPLAIRTRLATLRQPRRLDWRTLLLVIASVVIGGVTHVFWDSFTHAGAVVDALPWLATSVHEHPVYKWAQWASSLLGLGTVLVWAVLWLRRAHPVDPAPSRLSTPQRWAGWGSVVAGGLAGSLPVWIVGAANGLSLIDNRLVFRTVTVGLACAVLVAVLWCLAWYRLRPTPSMVARGAVRPSA